MKLALCGKISKKLKIDSDVLSEKIEDIFTVVSNRISKY